MSQLRRLRTGWNEIHRTGENANKFILGHGRKSQSNIRSPFYASLFNLHITEAASLYSAIPKKHFSSPLDPKIHPDYVYNG